jgi:hypothetical protein
MRYGVCSWEAQAMFVPGIKEVGQSFHNFTLLKIVRHYFLTFYNLHTTIITLHMTIGFKFIY